jgi:hypothetical protein
MNEMHIDGCRFEIEGGGPPVAPERLEALESRLGAPLPRQLRQYYERFNGGMPCPAEVPPDQSVWVRLPWPADTAAAYGGPGTAMAEWLQVDGQPDVDWLRTWQDFRKRLPDGLLPFARDAGGGLFVIATDGERLGRIFYWARAGEADLGRGEVPGWRNIVELAPSLKGFLLALRAEPAAGESVEAWACRVAAQEPGA